MFFRSEKARSAYGEVVKQLQHFCRLCQLEPTQISQESVGYPVSGVGKYRKVYVVGDKTKIIDVKDTKFLTVQSIRLNRFSSASSPSKLISNHRRIS